MLISEALSESNGRLAIGGTDVISLCEEFDTPLYIMDEALIRKHCRIFKDSLVKYYGENSCCAFASKAFSCVYMYKILKEEGLGADVVSGGELHTANLAGLPMNRVYFHGNNKSDKEIDLGVRLGVGRFVVDNIDELKRLDRSASNQGKVLDISFRIKPGIDAHTHEFIRTGQIDSKFGVALETGEAYDFVEAALSMKNVRLVGVHCHIGSQIFEIEPFMLAARVLVNFIREVKKRFNHEISEINLGGGFGIKYLTAHDPIPLEECIKAIAETVKNAVEEAGIIPPRLVLEPGRSIVGPAGITVYKVGCVKNIPGVRNYISVDGGMADNPRYILYRSEYEAVLPARPSAERTTLYTVAGKCCESGDLLIKDIMLPEVKAGDYLAVLATGAYNYSMASNYNRIPRLPVIMVNNGSVKVAVRRETYDDLVICDAID